MSMRPVAINLRTDSWEQIVKALESRQWNVDEVQRAKCARLIKEIKKRIEE